MTLDIVKLEVPLPSSDERNGKADCTNRRKVISDRLEVLSEVEDGWYEGRGVALDRAGLRWLDQQMADHYIGTDLPLPHLYPLESGGVIGEWSLERFECAIEIDLQSRSGSWVDGDLETGDGIDEHLLNLNSADDWGWLVERLAKLITQS